jgi:ACS family tartrate transporter-like MFS transporter
MSEQEPSRSRNIERAVLQKVMTRLVPLLAVLYVFCLLDRGNVSIAALTMQKDLRFGDTVYGLGAGMFFPGYFLFEVPSNLIMERVGARRWIARIMLTWGILSAAMLCIRTPLHFYVLRFLLGLAEAGFYPGILLYLTYWVPATVRAQVIARFLALTAVLGLFGGPLGGLLLTFNGRHGLTGWQWLFLMEGVPSILLGFLVLKILPDRPVHAAWLSQEEKEWVAARLAQEAASEERVQQMTWRTALSEPRIFTLCLIFLLTATGGNAVGFFGPQLLKSRSGGAWSDSFTATMGIFPALVGAVAMTLAAVHSDRTGQRRRHVVLGYLVAGAGFLLCVFAPTAWGVLLALCLNALGERIAAGSYWTVTTNLMGARAAAGGIAFINSVGNLGGFFGPVLMGELKHRSHGGYTAGLYTAAGLMMAASLLAWRTLLPPSSDAAPVAERAEGIDGLRTESETED